MKTMKILWSSNAPWSTSGYGNQSALFLPRIRDAGHQVAVNCFFGLEGGSLEWNGIPCFPTDQSRFGNLLLGEYADRHGEGDRTSVHVLTLQDVWVLLPGVPNFGGVNFTCWTPVDHDPIPPLVARFLEQTQARVIAMSRFGEAQLVKAGFEPMYAPHAVPTTVFKPELEKQTYYREGLNIPPDAFVVGMVANNQGIPSRKSFPQVFQAFKQFHERHRDAVLYVHADVFGRNNGVNLVELGRIVGIPSSALLTTDQLSLHLGIPQDLVAGVMNSLDVLCMPSFGEGFGIPLIEAQACGVPVITTDWTAMTELCGAGWLVEGEPWYDATQGSFFKGPYVADILDALEQSYEHARDMKLRESARRFALGYDVDHVFDTYWRPVLDWMERPREIEPLRLVA